MKKTFILAVIAGFFAAGCASTGNQGTDQSVQLMTFEQAMQKSQETRQQIQDAKTAYTQAQVISEVAGGADNLGDAAKNQVKKQLKTAKQKIKEEKEAWEDTLKN
jgi:guanylate kinase